MNITSPKEISEILTKYGLSPLKKYGQNFLCDGNVVEKIAEGSGVTKDDCVLEVGPGLGALTQALAKRAKKVVFLHEKSLKNAGFFIIENHLKTVIYLPKLSKILYKNVFKFWVKRQ